MSCEVEGWLHVGFYIPCAISALSKGSNIRLIPRIPLYEPDHSMWGITFYGLPGQLWISTG